MTVSIALIGALIVTPQTGDHAVATATRISESCWRVDGNHVNIQERSCRPAADRSALEAGSRPLPVRGEGRRAHVDGRAQLHVCLADLEVSHELAIIRHTAQPGKIAARPDGEPVAPPEKVGATYARQRTVRVGGPPGVDAPTILGVLFEVDGHAAGRAAIHAVEHLYRE